MKKFLVSKNAITFSSGEFTGYQTVNPLYPICENSLRLVQCFIHKTGGSWFAAAVSGWYWLGPAELGHMNGPPAAGFF